MTVVRGFADLSVGEEVRLVTVEGAEPTVISGRVGSVSRFALHVLLPAGVGAVAGMGVNAEVGVHRTDGRVGYAKVVALDEGGPDRLLLGPLFASSSTDDNRRNSRLAVESVHGHAFKKNGQGAAVFPIEVVDLSAGGAQIRTMRTLAVGDQVTIILDLLQRLGVKQPAARIAWVRRETTGTRAGVEFVSLTEAERNAIGYFVFKTQTQQAG